MTATLAPASDSGEFHPAGPGRVDVDGLAPGGQLTLLGPAQLGLDGRAYATGRPDERSEESSLGPLHGLSASAEAGTLRWARQTAMWELLGPLSPLLPGLKGERVAKCCKVRCGRPGSEVAMLRSESGAWSVAGCVICGNAHVCPLCAYRRAKQAAVELSAAFERHLATGRYADAWLGSFTAPHHRVDDWSLFVRRLLAAWATLQGDPAFRRWRRRWGLRPIVRVLDDTIGGNGLHAHFHVALLPTRASWAGIPIRGKCDEDRAAHLEWLTDELRPMWRRACERAGFVCPPDFDAHGVDVTGAELDGVAQYFCKWGFSEEVALSPSKGGRTHWNLLDEYRAGDYTAGRDFVRYYEATKGVAVVTGLARLLADLEIGEDDVEAHRAELRARRQKQLAELGEELHVVRELRVHIAPWLHARALSLGWATLAQLADDVDAAGGAVQSEIDRVLMNHRTRREATRGPPGDTS